MGVFSQALPVQEVSKLGSLIYLTALLLALGNMSTWRSSSGLLAKFQEAATQGVAEPRADG